MTGVQTCALPICDQRGLSPQFSRRLVSRRLITRPRLHFCLNPRLWLLLFRVRRLGFVQYFGLGAGFGAPRHLVNFAPCAACFSRRGLALACHRFLAVFPSRCRFLHVAPNLKKGSRKGSLDQDKDASYPALRFVKSSSLIHSSTCFCAASLATP